MNNLKKMAPKKSASDIQILYVGLKWIFSKASEEGTYLKGINWFIF